MNNDDSFNDSDEIFNLYSSKKVTETFKAQLKKIAASSRLNNETVNVATEDFVPKKDKDKDIVTEKDEDIVTEKDKNIITENDKDIITVKDEYYTDEETETEEEWEEMAVTVVNKPKKTIESSLSTSSNNLMCEFLEDSIEIISDHSPRTTRRSRRIKNKRRQNSCECIQPLKNAPVNSSTPINKRSGRGKKKSRKNKKKKSKVVEEVTIEDSSELEEDELNPEVSVKVIWKSVNIKKFQMRKFQKLSFIYEQLSKEEKIPEDKIILTFNNVRVKHNDTPESLNLQIYHFLDGGVLSELSNSCQTPNALSSTSNSDSLILKFQDVNKKVIKLNLNKNEKLKIGMIKCSEQLEVPLSRIKFYFDGELLQPYETPNSLGLENEEVIDIKIC